MGSTGWTWLLVLATFGLYLAVAILWKVRSGASYYVAERRTHPALEGMATGTDWISAASFLSMAGVVALSGRDGAAWIMGWTGGYVLLAVLLAPYLRKYGKYTVTQFVGERYYSSGARLVALLCAVLVSFFYVVGQLRGVGVVLARLLEVPLGAAIAWGALATFLFVLVGGMKGITASAVAQYLVLIAAFLVPAVLSSSFLTGSAVPQLGLSGRLTTEGAALLHGAPGEGLVAAVDRLGVELGFPPYTGGWHPRLEAVALAASLMFGTAGLPHIVIRFFTVPKIRDARATAAWALVFIAVLYLTAPAVAVFARAHLLGSLHGRAHAEAPAWVGAWERTGLVGFTDRDGDGRMTVSGDPARNEVRVDPDVLVLAHPEMAGLPPWVIGLVAAGALAAALGTAAGLVLVIASGFAHDLVRSTFAPRMSERAELSWARFASAAAVAGAAWLAARGPGNVAQLVAWAFGLAASSFFPAIVLGIFWRRATREGAVAGMVAGTLLTLGYVVRFGVLDPARADAAAWWFGISPEGIGALGMLVALGVAVAVSLATPAPPERVQALVAGLRYPREARRPRA